MSAPRSVPQPAHTTHAYHSAPRRFTPWSPDRPGEIDGRQPHGDRLGTPAPGGGYAVKLSESLASAVHCQPGERVEDALAGAAAIANKRASLFGRAPVIHDIRVALAVWGFLSDNPAGSLVERRRALFAEAAHPHDYFRLRALVDAVPDEVLVASDQEILEAATSQTSLIRDLDA